MNIYKNKWVFRISINMFDIRIYISSRNPIPQYGMESNTNYKDRF